MSKTRTGGTPERPREGGSYVRQKGGKLKLTERTKPAAIGAAPASATPHPNTQAPAADAGEQQKDA